MTTPPEEDPTDRRLWMGGMVLLLLLVTGVVLILFNQGPRPEPSAKAAFESRLPPPEIPHAPPTAQQPPAGTGGDSLALISGGQDYAQSSRSAQTFQAPAAPADQARSANGACYAPAADKPCLREVAETYRTARFTTGNPCKIGASQAYVSPPPDCRIKPPPPGFAKASVRCDLGSDTIEFDTGFALETEAAEPRCAEPDKVALAGGGMDEVPWTLDKTRIFDAFPFFGKGMSYTCRNGRGGLEHFYVDRIRFGRVHDYGPNKEFTVTMSYRGAERNRMKDIRTLREMARTLIPPADINDNCPARLKP